MSVIINLKELFATDSQVEVSSKINFNFNQLLALGVGQTGPAGPQGPQGAAGPIGPIGPKGPSGSVIYGTVPTVASPNAPIGAPSSVSLGDILITTDRILKKVETSPTNTYGWDVITDFNTLVRSALGSNVSPYVRLGSTSRIVKPKVTSGIDLTNSSTSSDPNYNTPGFGSNYQTVFYNFNELNTKSVVNDSGTIQIKSNSSSTISIFANVLLGSGSPPSTFGIDLINDTISTAAAHGLSTGDFITYSTEGGNAIGGLSNGTGYYVKQISTTEFSLCDSYSNALAGTPVIDLTSLGTLASGSPHKLITYPSNVDLIFPQSSNLSLYSFFNSTADQAKEFATTAKGYRSQLELGSLDTLPTAYNGITAQNFVISPSFENLRVRKYRIGSFSISGGNAANPGNYMLRAEYDISSSGSELPESFSPRRNSEQVWIINKAGASQNDGRTISMKLTNQHVLANTEATAVAAGVTVDGLFFKRSTNFGGTSAETYFGIGFNTTSNNSIDFRAPSGMTFNFSQNNIVLGSGTTSTLKGNGIDFVSSTGVDWTITSINGNIKLRTLNSAATISLNNAVVVKEDRLAQGLPFPVVQVVSTDPNTLDDYEEGTWTPTLYGGALQNLATSNPSFKQLMTGTVGALSSYSNPARASWVGPPFGAGLIEEQGLYGPIGSGSAYTYRDIPIDVDYARYIKIGKKVTCWVNFTINPNFNWITTTYTGTWNAVNTQTQTFTAGTNTSRCDFLYRINGSWLNSCAIGLTLPFGAAVAPSSGSDSYPPAGYEPDQLETVLAGNFNLQIDNTVKDITLFGRPSYPVAYYPAFYQEPIEVTAGTATGGDVRTSGAVGLRPNMLPINPTGKSEIRIGYVQTRYTQRPGPFFLPIYSYSPAALFFGERDFANTLAFTSTGGRRTLGTSRLSPVTAFDCIYEAWVPTSAPADGIFRDRLIRFQCQFTYETAT